MNASDKTWLENRISASISDDFYLDRDEEKRIKEEASARNILIKDLDYVLLIELDKQGAVSERLLLDELDRLLHQFTDNDKYLDPKEERDALDKVLVPAPKKKKGLDPRVAKEYADSFCQVNGVRRAGGRKWIIPVIAGVVLVVIAVVALLPRISGTYNLLVQDKSEIDDLFYRASQYVEQSQYTDPPEKSAKACIDRIKALDPKGTYRDKEISALIDKITGRYIALAQKSFSENDLEGAKKWLGRATLFNKNSEIIRDKEREFGIVKSEK